MKAEDWIMVGIIAVLCIATGLLAMRIEMLVEERNAAILAAAECQASYSSLIEAQRQSISELREQVRDLDLELATLGVHAWAAEPRWPSDAISPRANLGAAGGE